MSALSASGIAYARCACRRALEFFYSPEQRGTEAQRQRLRVAIGAELERVAMWPEAAQGFEEIAAAVLTAPGVVSCFLQRTAALDRTSIVRGSNGTDIPLQSKGFRDEFRVFIHTGSKHAEATHADLLTAVREAFERAKVPLPKRLAE